jgi:predicted Holliday junction resolvase-like endonuclease
MYVFGVDLPIMEMLFVFVLLLFVALIIVFFEVRKLRKLILTEQSDIYRFEEDISKLGKKDMKKHSKSLDEYIKKAKDRGFNQKEIEDILIKKGWPKELVDDSFNKI